LSPSRVKTFFSLLDHIHTGSGVHPNFYSTSTGGDHSPEVKWPGREANHSPLTGAEVKKT
jgi:hypothetical protein